MQRLASALGPDQRVGRHAAVVANHAIEEVIAQRVERFERGDQLCPLCLGRDNGDLPRPSILLLLRDAP